MKHLRIFENYKSDEEIHKICEKYKIENYTINKDGSIDVNNLVDLYKKELTELPLIFNKVDIIFSCGDNKLTTLKGSPRIVNGGFRVYQNRLSDLIGGPVEVRGWYSCWENQQLTSLEGIAKIIEGNLEINNCFLKDFRGIPEDIIIQGDIDFSGNPVWWNLKEFLDKYNINIKDIKDKYLDLMIEINELDAIQDGKIIDIRMDEVLYNIGLI